MKNISTLPILLKNQKILIVGGGSIALQKAKVLHDNNITFSVVAKRVKKHMHRLCEDIKIKKFKKGDIGYFYIIIDATGNKNVYKKLKKYKEERNILINIVDQPKKCDFYFMALTKNANVQIAVTSNGASPTLAASIRDKAIGLIPDEIDRFAKKLKSKRSQGEIDKEKTLKELSRINAKVQLVGCGIGNPELLTLMAYRAIKEADVVLYDHLVSDEILEMIPSHISMYYVGKTKGKHSMLQSKINQMMIDMYGLGKRVVRLKSGDPFVFGRGAEELDALMRQNIEVEVVPGISSAMAAPLCAGIPLTARGYASSFTVVSAHLKGDSLNLDWIEKLRDRSHTVVVLMGLSRTMHIAQKAYDAGIDMKTQCMIVSNASRKNQKIIITDIDNLHIDSLKAGGPAVIVFGSVLEFANKHKGD